MSMSTASPNVHTLPVQTPRSSDDAGDARIVMLAIAVGLIPSAGRRIPRLTNKPLQQAC